MQTRVSTNGDARANDPAHFSTTSYGDSRGTHNGAQAHPIDAQTPQPLPVQLNNVPPELRERKNWVCWRYEVRSDKPDEKPTKIPYQPNGNRASATDATTWRSFDVISKAYATGKFSGVGFVLSGNDEFSGVDLDGMIDAKTGEVSTEAQDILKLVNSYSEISPSGTGLRIWTRGQLPGGARRKGKIEAYDTARYLTFTGHRIEGTPACVGERTQELSEFHARYLARQPKEKPKSAPKPNPDSMLDSDAELIARAGRARNGARFTQLWNGDFGDDHSLADSQLCALLYFWTQGDASRIDSLFRQSGLMRDKWDERRGAQTYGERTIENAMRNGGEIYKPRNNRQSAPRNKTKSTGSETSATIEQPPAPTLTPEEIRETFKERATKSAPPVTLEELICQYRKWMYVKDDRVIKVTLATFAANLCDGDPSWLMIVGGSSSGKTETVLPLSALPFARLVGTLTEGSFLSGSSKRDSDKNASGGLLREVGEFGVLLLKDFTSILSIHHDKRVSVLAALREIYDGSWTRDIGNDGGRKLEWRGKIGIIACCTDAIESAHAVSGAMGERFMRYRLQHSADDQREITRLALRRRGRDSQMRAELEAATVGFFGALDLTLDTAHLTEFEENRLISIAMLTAKARSVVDRDAKTRDIELVHDAEIPARFAAMLGRLLHGLKLIKVSDAEAWEIVGKVALDSIPKLRAQIIQLLSEQLDSGVASASAEIQRDLNSSRSSIERALADLKAHELLVTREETQMHNGDARKVTGWAFSELGEALWLEGFAPGNSCSVKSPTTHTSENTTFENSSVLHNKTQYTVPDDFTEHENFRANSASASVNFAGVDEFDIN